MQTLYSHNLGALNFYANHLSERNEFKCSLLSYVGQIHPAFLPNFIEQVERLSAKRHEKQNQNRLAVVLSTPGGIVETVEKMVSVIRHHFNEVFFVVPVSAMSAGTILCMSGDKIFMDYTSSLGPIDPQVQGPDGRFVPALGYLDKVNELIAKSRTPGGLTDAEFMMLRAQDLATLRRYEQARDLSVSLMKDYLVKYKFRDWLHHRTTTPGEAVTTEQKECRAEEIAKSLSNNNIWHSHGRLIGIEKLSDVLKLEIADYSSNMELRNAIRSYSDLLEDFCMRNQQQQVFIHTSCET